jgi:glycosyltransferase involved in cell wall biosynthesis
MRGRALLLAPEVPSTRMGGGPMRTASLLAYLKTRYEEVDVMHFDLPQHSNRMAARVWRNARRLLTSTPPLFDRYSGHPVRLQGRYDVAIVEHFWCASYAGLLRAHAERLILNLHNVESALARTHAAATRGLASLAFRRFAKAYAALETQWLPKFDTVLVTSEADRARVCHPHTVVYPNALPHACRNGGYESHCLVFSGNLAYHPNVEAVRWFHKTVWPRILARIPDLTWRLVGRNPHAVEAIIKGDRSVHVTGAVDDSLEEIRQAKLCVVPIISGSGTRFKILEAWAAGRAVVSTALGAEGLDARPGKHLLIANSPAAFSGTVLAALESLELRRTLGSAGRALYEQNYTWPQAWKALERAGI